MATLSSQEPIHATLVDAFLSATKASNVEILTAESFHGSVNETPRNQLENIKKKGATVIFLAAYADDARNIVCFSDITCDRISVRTSDLATLLTSLLALSRGISRYDRP